jgi:hypothetical protein
MWSLPDGRAALVDEEGTSTGGIIGGPHAGAGPHGGGALGPGPPRGCILQEGCTGGRDTNDVAEKVVEKGGRDEDDGSWYERSVEADLGEDWG